MCVYVCEKEKRWGEMTKMQHLSAFEKKKLLSLIHISKQKGLV